MFDVFSYTCCACCSLQYSMMMWALAASFGSGFARRILSVTQTTKINFPTLRAKQQGGLLGIRGRMLELLLIQARKLQRSCKGSDQRAQRVLKKSDAHNDECTHSTFSHRSAHAPSDGSGHRLWHRPLKGAPLPDEPNAWRNTVCIVE